MIIKNISKRSYCHALVNEKGETEIFMLDAGETKEIPDNIAKVWLKTGEVVGVDDGSKDKEIERLKAENEKLKAEANEKEKDELLEKCKELNHQVQFHTTEQQE